MCSRHDILTAYKGERYFATGLSAFVMVVLRMEMKQRKQSLLFKVSDERGQGMSEYVIVVLLVACVCIPIAKLLPDAIRGYARPFFYCLSKPFP